MGKFVSSCIQILSRIERGICYAALITLALLPVLLAILKPFNIAIAHSRLFLVHIFLLAGFFSAMITTSSGEHISIGILHYLKNEKVKSRLAFVASLVSVLITTVLFWNSLSFFHSSPAGRMVGFLPESFFIWVMALAYAVMALRFAFVRAKNAAKNAAKTTLGILLSVLVLIVGSILALPALAKLGVTSVLSEPLFAHIRDFINFQYDAAFYTATPLILLLTAAALIGTPIFVVIGGIALIMLQAAGSEPEAAPIQIFSALTDGDLIAIPLFTLSGFFLSESKAGERLVAVFRCLFSWLPGGLIISTVVICTFFTSFTGASGVTILALGGILLVVLQKGGSASSKGYPEKFSMGLLTSAGGMGILFPPSLPLILVASTINSILFFMGGVVKYDIVDFFLAAILPGGILVLAMIVYSLIASRKVKIPLERFDMRQTRAALKNSAFEMLLPLILMGGYFSGILTLMEVSAVAVVYVFALEVFIHRDIALKDVPKVFLKAIPIIGGILAILAMAKALSYAVIDSQVPESFAQWVRDAVQSRHLFLLLLNLALLLVGCVMDIFSAILVLLPLIVPLASVYGINPVHLGIIFLVNLEASFLTPPVGINLFLASYRFNKPFTEICGYVLPFLVVRLAVVLLVTYIPWFSSFLLTFR